MAVKKTAAKGTAKKTETAKNKTVKVKSKGAAAGPKATCCPGGVGSLRK